MGLGPLKPGSEKPDDDPGAALLGDLAKLFAGLLNIFRQEEGIIITAQERQLDGSQFSGNLMSASQQMTHGSAKCQDAEEVDAVAPYSCGQFVESEGSA